MTTFIPLFPLNIVVYPGEQLNLHIFEPRYKQLITECYEEKKDFGIATAFKNGISEIGTSVEIISIEKVHENGEMDIKTCGKQVFKILEQVNEIPNKIFGGAIVSYPLNEFKGLATKMKRLLEDIRLFHSLLEVSKVYKKNDTELNAYDLAHHAGLNLEEEYQLLCLFDEAQRQEFLLMHLKKTIPTITELQLLKRRIEMNGHFRKLSVNEGNEEA